MQMSEIHDYARQLLGVYGDKARALAAQKAVEGEKRGEHHEAEDWGAFVMRSQRCGVRISANW